jgi:excisionase family DNA binding protein
MNQETRLLTVREVAERLSVTPRTVHRYLADGKLPRVQLSERAVRIRETDLQAFIEERLKGGHDDD